MRSSPHQEAVVEFLTLRLSYSVASNVYNLSAIMFTKGHHRTVPEQSGRLWSCLYFIEIGEKTGFLFNP